MAHSKHWIGVLALLLAGCGLVALGRWQLDRAEFNRGISERFAEAVSLPELNPAELGAPNRGPAAARPPLPDELRYRRIRLHGSYQPERQILLDNMTHQGQAGYQVLTPLELTGGRAVLVNRGWLPASPDRSRLPEVAIGNPAVDISGRVDRLPRAALELAAPPVAAGSVIVMSYPDFTALEAALGRTLEPYIVLLDPAASQGFVRDWQPDGSRANRNIAYAVQWFGLALLAFVLAVGMLLRGRQHAREGTV